MKKSQLRQLIREEISKYGGKYQVIFNDEDYDEYPYTDSYFDSEREAEDFINNNSYEDDIYSWGDNGPYYKRVTRYYNPQDQENYHNYEIKKNK